MTFGPTTVRPFQFGPPGRDLECNGADGLEMQRGGQKGGWTMTREPGTDATDNLTELQKALLGTQTLEQFLQELATLAARLVNDGVSCGMTMRPNGRPVTVACSDPLASEIDEVQYRLDDGPCLHAMRCGDQVT